MPPAGNDGRMPRLATRAARSAGRLTRLVAGASLLAAIPFAIVMLGHRRPQDMPWGPLDLGDPVGLSTGRKLAALRGDAPACRRLLDRSGIAYRRLPLRTDGPGCGYDDGIRVRTAGPLAIAYRPAIGASCAVAATLATWEWQVVQVAAQAHFGARVVAIDDFGSYSCRRIGHARAGRTTANWSEHATANAVDIAGFRLSDGTRITVARDWSGTGAKAAFLRAVRDGACRLFATTLSPDYNAAHRDHLHLDQADRGPGGWRACR